MMNPRILLAAFAAMAIFGTPAASAQPRPAPAPSKAEPARGDTKPAPKGDARYGNWDRTWGAQPPAPPKHFTKQGDWYRHVRACQRVYKSYSPRSDTYRSHGGKTLRCRL